MKMQNVDIEIIEFDTLDVIATSGGGGSDVDDSTVKTIWMTPQSVLNFNQMYDNDFDLYLDDDPSAFSWYGYTGKFASRYSEWSAGKTILIGDPDPTDGIRTVAAGDTVAYQRVLDWLEKNKS